MMNKIQRYVIICNLINQLRKYGNWCGETSIQKAAYMLDELFEIPWEYNFILYKHGPYSFDFKDELMEMKGNGLIASEICDPYGPRLYTTEIAQSISSKFQKTQEKYHSSIDFVAKSLGNKKLAELERIATALFVTKKFPDIENSNKRAEKIHILKPHVPTEKALNAIIEIDTVLSQVAAI